MIIKNALIYDGTGCDAYKADILIEDGLIKQIGQDISAEGGQLIDASNRIVTPGFVDIHRHCDNRPFYGDGFGLTLLAQGITTTVVGNCGISAAPLSRDEKLRKETIYFDEPVLGANPEKYFDFPEYLDGLGQVELPVNMAALIGTGSVKISIKGFENKPYTRDEIEASRRVIREAMEAGAPGVSVGIMYLPECYNTKQDYIDILQSVGELDGIVTAHIRGEGDSMVDSVREMIEIAEAVGCRLEISHFKSCGTKNWKKEIFRAIEEIEKARARGLTVYCDLYPYDGGSTALTTMIPPEFINGDLNTALLRLGTESGVERFREMLDRHYDDWDNFALTLGWERIIISGVVKEENKKFLGMNAVAAAEKYHFKDAVELAAHLLHSENGRTAIINMSMCQDDIDTIMRLPYAIIISDSIYADTATPHPRLNGAFPKVIREYVMERGVLTLQEAVMKMTWLPAQRMKLEKRGRIAEGFWADINIFNPEQFRDHADYQHSAELSSGLDYCILAGNIAYQNGEKAAQNFGQLVRVKHR